MITDDTYNDVHSDVPSEVGNRTNSPKVPENGALGESGFIVPPSIVPLEARLRADSEQKEVDRLGLHPKWNQYKGGLSFAGIVNRNNEVVVSEKEYHLISAYTCGLAMAQRRKTLKCGFIDRNGNEVIPATWRSAGLFSEYLCGVQDENRRCGYIDITGRIVIQCLWDECWPFHKGFARVQSNKRIGMVDQSGKLVIPCIWKGMSDFNEGLAGVEDENGKCGFVDQTGKVVIPCQWKRVWVFQEGLAVVQDFENKRLGFIDKSGKLIIPCIWKRVNFFQNGLAKVSNSRFFFKYNWVYIDKQGKVVKKG